MPTWKTIDTLNISDTQFRVGFFSRRTRPKFSEFLVSKHRWMVEKYIGLFESFQSENIFLLGILHGGCCAMFYQLAKPKKLIAIDIDPAPVPALEKYIDERGIREVIRPYYGVDQSDQLKLRQICAWELSGSPLDLVIDDASHFLQETRISFNSLFPLLRAGGLYVIEDWSWAHASPTDLRISDGFLPDKTPLTILVFELLLACGSVTGLFEDIVINENSVWITRGPLELDPLTFDISKLYLPRGRRLIAGFE